MFATLAVGGYYAPLNVTAPSARNSLIMRSFGPDVILTSLDHAKSASEMAGNATVIVTEDLTTSAPIEPLSGHLAYYYHDHQYLWARTVHRALGVHRHQL